MISPPTLTNLENEAALKQHYFSPFSHWLIPNLVMIGESPANEKESIQYKTDLICKEGKCGTFVALQAEFAPQTNGTVLMGGYADWNKESGSINPTYSNHAIQSCDEPKFIHYGIRDEDTAESLESLERLILDLKERVDSGEVLYIHCKGGKGRAGIVGAGLLSKFYPTLDDNEILKRTQMYCEMRYRGRSTEVPSSVKSPETNSQKEQVRQFLATRENSV